MTKHYPDLMLYIGGAWRKTPNTLPVLNPADETVIGAVPVATRADLDEALDAAAKGFSVWRRVSPAKRRGDPQGRPAHARTHRRDRP